MSSTNSQELLNKVKLDSISFLFQSDSSELHPKKGQLTKLKKYTSEIYTIEIHSYSDKTGTSSHNKKLREKRMENTMALLDSIGIHTISKTISLTENNNPNLSDSLNRRVDVLIYRVDTIKFNQKIKLMVNFYPSETRIISESKIVVTNLAIFLNKNVDIKIELHGHVCCTDDYSFSLERAIAIKKLLIKSGVQSSRIETFGHSNKEPVAKEINEEGMQKNRRVEIVFKR